MFLIHEVTKQQIVRNFDLSQAVYPKCVVKIVHLFVGSLLL